MATPANDPQLQRALTELMDLAVARHRAGDLPTAELLYAKILSITPANVGVLHNLAVVRSERGDLDGGVALLDEGVRLAPREAQLHYARALMLQHAGRLDAAVEGYRAALALNPRHGASWENLGVALQDGEHYPEAAAAYREALALNPDSLIASLNLANVLRTIGRYTEALNTTERALERYPADGALHRLRGTTLLTLGDFMQGWREYEWRYGVADGQEKHKIGYVPLPKWDGRALRDDGILLYGEQGLGDEIMFSAGVSQVAAAARHTVLECEPRLAALFARSFPDVEVVARGDDYDHGWLTGRDLRWRLSTASLPSFQRRSEAEFGGGHPWLKADPEQVSRWATRLAGLGDGLRIGISWRGGAEARARGARSVPLALWEPLFAQPGVRFISLQYGDHRDEISEFNRGRERPLVVFDDMDPLRDVDGMAALTSALDLIISVDNSTVHLAGALGAPTWALLPRNADFRWGIDGTDSVWYRSIRLWRLEQQAAAAWPPLLARVASALADVPRRNRPSGSTGSETVARPAVREERSAGAKVLLLNDTSYWYHWGCTCTSLAIHAELRERGFRVSSIPAQRTHHMAGVPLSAEGFDDEGLFASFAQVNRDIVDALAGTERVIINGEGTLHDAGAGALGLLYLAWVAKKRFGRPVAIINHSCYPDTVNNGELATRLYARVYGELDFVAAREPVSADAVRRSLGVDPVESFDCLPLYLDRWGAESRGRDDTVVLAGSVAWTPEMVDTLASVAAALRSEGLRVQLLVGSNAWPAADDGAFVRMFAQRFKGGYELVGAQNENEWLSTIARARLLISGRFHHTIAAAFLGTPFLVGESNTAKIGGLLQRLELPAGRVRFGAGTDVLVMARNLLEHPEDGRLTQAARERLLALSRNNFGGWLSGI